MPLTDDEKLMQPEQEPIVKWDANAPLVVHPHPAFKDTPPQRKPLTDKQREEIAKGWRGRNWTLGDVIDAVEAAHGITGEQHG